MFTQNYLQAPDYASDTIGITSNLGLLSSQLQLTQRADNVDNTTAFLKNRSRNLNLSIAAPLGQMINSQTPSKWLPNISYAYAINHSFADTAYIPMFQTLANLPNMDILSHNLGLNWQIDTFNIGYQLSRTLQDNSQIGFERQDARDIAHTVNASYPLTTTLNINGSGGQRTSTQLDTGLERYNHNASAGLSWLIDPRYNLSSTISTSRDTDSIASPVIRSLQAQLQMVKQFDIRSYGKKLPAQWSASYAQSNSENSGLIARYQTFNLALNFSFF